jgi:hypothetical protein
MGRPISRHKRVGEVFGYWTIIGVPEHKDKRWGMYKYTCRCVCSLVKDVFATCLLSGSSLSCGCMKLGRKRPYESLYNNIAYKSERRGLSFELTYEEFIEFTKIKACHYCGDEVSWSEYSINVAGVGSNLDRKDSNLGYSALNCTVCCGECNRMKSNNFTYEEFMQLSPALKTIQIVRKVRNEETR